MINLGASLPTPRADLRKYSEDCKIAREIIPEKYTISGAGGLLAASYANSTWKKFNCALKSYEKFLCDSNMCIVWPFSVDNLSKYVCWGSEKGYRASTIESYLALLKNIHKLKGLESKNFDDYVLKSLIRGKENIEIYSKEVKATRKVMTLHLLRILGHAISKSSWAENSKLVVWGAATTAFFGSFRCGELLSQNENSFSPDDCLLWKDVKVYEDDHILIHVKNPKTKTKGGEFVDIFGFEGKGVCPVKALKKLKESVGNVDPNTPVFCFKSGTCLTRRKLNEILYNLLRPYIGEDAKNITGHSFRARIPAVLAKFPDICNASDIMGWGRWKSEAYLLYTRLKIDQKRCTYRTIVSLLNKE